MKAEDARKLTAGSAAELEPKTAIVLGCWHAAFAMAARAGRREVRESDVDRPRTPIPLAAREAAVARLRADGFTVKTVQTGMNESETEVSW